MNTTNTMGVLLAAGSLTALGLAETGCSYPNFDFGTGGSGGSMSTISTGGMGTGGSMPGINKMLLDYEFDVPGATEPDKSGNGFNGTLQGLNANSYVQIVPGNDALSFGGNGWVSVGVHSAFEGMNRLKIRARVNSDTQVGFAPIISDWVANPTPWSFFTNMDGSTTSCEIVTTSGNAVVVGGTKIFGNGSGYHDVECVYDGAQVYLTIDGQKQAGGKALTGAIKQDGGFVGAGALYDKPTQKALMPYFPGQMDYVQVLRD